MDLGLTGKSAVVTGASRGIGLATAVALAAEGAAVGLVARNPDNLAGAVEQVAQHGTRVVALTADTTDSDAVSRMAAQATAELGNVDILVNCAATPASGASSALADLQDDVLRAEIETKVLGYLRCARAFAPGMSSRGWGRIINVSGLAARMSGSVFGSIRNVAVAAMTKNLADELGPSGINVTVVHPGMTATERTPGLMATWAQQRGVSVEQVEQQAATANSIKRMVTAAEIADVITFLASPRSVAINGDAVAVGGGTPGAIYY
jgi:NAD(P)-dependent dehydrogenase (short-subunit alcohol dehydrogenase family)